MGVFYGLVMFGTAFWCHASVIKQNEPLPEAEKENAIKWFGIGAATFLLGVVLGYLVNWLFVEGILGGVAIGIGGGIGEASGGDTGIQAIILELIPLITGLLIVYLVRLKFIQKKQIGISKLINKLIAKNK